MKFHPRNSADPVTEISNEEFDKIEKEAPKQETLPVEETLPKEVLYFKNLSPTAAVNVRTNPDTKSTSIGVIYPGEKFEVESFDKDWYKIMSGDKKGAYVRKDFMK